MECHARCKTKYERVEKGFLDLQDLETEAWIGNDEELDGYLTKMDTESEACFNQFSEVQHSNTELFEKCSTLTAPAKPTMTRQTQAAPSITTLAFKPQADLKPTFLIKDCTLTEFNKFNETFITY